MLVLSFPSALVVEKGLDGWARMKNWNIRRVRRQEDEAAAASIAEKRRSRGDSRLSVAHTKLSNLAHMAIRKTVRVTYRNRAAGDDGRAQPKVARV